MRDLPLLLLPKRRLTIIHQRSTKLLGKRRILLSQYDCRSFPPCVQHGHAHVLHQRAFSLHIPRTLRTNLDLNYPLIVVPSHRLIHLPPSHTLRTFVRLFPSGHEYLEPKKRISLSLLHKPKHNPRREYQPSQVYLDPPSLQHIARVRLPVRMDVPIHRVQCIL